LIGREGDQGTGAGCDGRRLGEGEEEAREKEKTATEKSRDGD